MKMKKMMALLLGATIVASLFTGCGAKETTGDNTSAKEESNKADEITLKFATYSAMDNKVFEAIELEKRFQEIHPNVSIELEEYKDATEYNNAMRVRASANELPDVMYMKATEFSNYQDFLVDMKDMEAAKNSYFSEDYAMGEKVCGVATVAGKCYIYYWEDMFKEAGVEVPQTWDELKDVTLKLQEHFTAQDPNFISLCVGAKDVWATYPYAEYMPMMESNNGNLFSTMATEDAPFAKGTDVYNGYKKVYDLFNLGVCGPDPLGVGHDQIATLFRAKKAGMIGISSGLIDQMVANGEDTTGLKSFYLPGRDTVEEAHNVVTLADNFISIAKDGKNVEMAKEFVEFFFSDEVYGDFIKNVSSETAMKTVDKELHPALESADVNSPDAVMVAQIGGNEDYAAIEAATKFNCKQLGSEFFIKGYDFDGKMEELNKAWADARKSLGIE